MSKLYCIQKVSISKINKNFTRVTGYSSFTQFVKRLCQIVILTRVGGRVKCQFWEMIIICPFLNFCFGFSFNTWSTLFYGHTVCPIELGYNRSLPSFNRFHKFFICDKIVLNVGFGKEKIFISIILNFVNHT